MKPSVQPNSLVASVIVVLASIATGPTGSAVYAQQLADSIVGESWGDPLTLSSRDACWIVELAQAARVPLGFEVAPLLPREGKDRKIAATGRKLGDVLDEFVQMDSRYRWREVIDVDAGLFAIRRPGHDFLQSVWSWPLHTARHGGRRECDGERT